MAVQKNCRDLLKTWADYLASSLPDPGDQLCTDDFEGVSPHNVNLAAKVGMKSQAIAVPLRSCPSQR